MLGNALLSLCSVGRLTSARETRQGWRLGDWCQRSSVGQCGVSYICMEGWFEAKGGWKKHVEPALLSASRSKSFSATSYMCYRLLPERQRDVVHTGWACAAKCATEPLQCTFIATELIWFSFAVYLFIVALTYCYSSSFSFVVNYTTKSINIHYSSLTFHVW